MRAPTWTPSLRSLCLELSCVSGSVGFSVHGCYPVSALARLAIELMRGAGNYIAL